MVSPSLVIIVWQARSGYHSSWFLRKIQIIFCFRSHSNKTVQSTLDAMQPAEILKVGGAGHKVCKISKNLFPSAFNWI